MLSNILALLLISPLITKILLKNQGKSEEKYNKLLYQFYMHLAHSGMRREHVCETPRLVWDWLAMLLTDPES